MNSPQVLIVLGSASDEEFLKSCTETLKKLEISYSVKVASAHRSADRLDQLLSGIEPSIGVILAFAGYAAHLAGVIASKVILPVVAVPLPTSDLRGIDALLSSVQMPGGIPVGTMGIGDAGSQNAACFAAQILALKDSGLKDRLKNLRKASATNVELSSVSIEKKWNP